MAAVLAPEHLFSILNKSFWEKGAECWTINSEHEDKLWRDTEKFKETIQKKDTELRRNEDAKRKMAADLKTKLQEKERGKLINPLDEIRDRGSSTVRRTWSAYLPGRPLPSREPWLKWI